MKLKPKNLAMALASAIMLTLVGCGGGGGGSSVTTSPTSTTTPAAAVFTGTAATGAALANANVTITNSSGNSPCQEASITTTALGSYTCTLKTGETAPFFVVVTDPTGNTPPMVSVATSTPAAGTPLTINVTPLTTAILAQLASDGNPLTLVNSKTADAAALKQLTANVVAQLANVLTAIGAPAGYDPFSTSITAATASGTGNTADMVLDVVKVVTDPATGKLALSTVDNPTPIILATATTTGATVARPAAGVSTLSQAAQIAAQAFTSCFALPTAQRVLTKDSTIVASLGGPEVADVGTACQNIVARLGNAAGMKFVHNGYSAGQLFYGLMTDDAMTGAQFSVPEIMAYFAADPLAAAGTPASRDRAVINIRFLDVNGNPGRAILVAARIPGSSSVARNTEWWLAGNQQPVDVSLSPQVRRVEQLNPLVTVTSRPNRISTFQSGINFNFNSKGPGSTNGADLLQLARVSGPGLPGPNAAGAPGGLVFVHSTGLQNSMDLYNKTGSLTVGSQCGNGVTTNCPNMWFARTQGTSGAAATTLEVNQSNGNWAQAADGFTPAEVVKGAVYKVELFYGTTIPLAAAAPALYTYNKVLLTDMVKATQAVNLPWNSPGSQTLAALDPNGSLTAAQTNLVVDWLQNPSAQQIGRVDVITDNATGSFGPGKSVARGALSVTIDNMTVPSFVATTAAPAMRTFSFGYRMLDGSIKTAGYQYN